MRLKITFKTVPGFKIPYNNNHTIASILYHVLEDRYFAADLHDSTRFKYFTFSQVQIPVMKIMPDGLITRDGRFHLQVSSADEDFIKNLWHGLFDTPTVDFQGALIEVESVEMLRTPRFREKMRFKTLSPVYLRTERDGRIWDLNGVDDEFMERLVENLLKKYNSFHGGKKLDVDLSGRVVDASVKQKRVVIDKGGVEIFHRANQLRLDLCGSRDVLGFAWDVGLGEKCSMGFGMVDVV